jgi:hypothetical protein
VNVLVAFIALAAILMLGYHFLRESDEAVRAGAWRLMLMVDDAPAATIDLRNGRLRVLMDAVSQADPPMAGEERFEIALTKEGLKRIIDALGGLVVHLPETINYRGVDGLPVRIDPGLRRLDADRVEAYYQRPGSSRAASLRVMALGLTARTAELDAAGISLARLLYAAMDGAARGDDGKNPYRLAGLLEAAASLGPADVSIEWASAGAAQPAPTAAASTATTPAVVNAAEEVNLPIKVRILNGTGRPGLAARASARLPIDAFRVLETANADRFGYTRTEVRAASAAAARLVIERLGVGAHVERGADRLAGADVEIVLGADARARW